MMHASVFCANGASLWLIQCIHVVHQYCQPCYWFRSLLQRILFRNSFPDFLTPSSALFVLLQIVLLKLCHICAYLFISCLFYQIVKLTRAESLSILFTSAAPLSETTFSVQLCVLKEMCTKHGSHSKWEKC